MDVDGRKATDTVGEARSVERDVVYFLHLQAQSGTFEHDIDWGAFPLDYPKYLACASEVFDDPTFVAKGILLILFVAALVQSAMGVPVPLKFDLQSCLETVRGVRYADGSMERLRLAVVDALQLAVSGLEDQDRVGELFGNQWVYELVVVGYFDESLRRARGELAG